MKRIAASIAGAFAIAAVASSTIGAASDASLRLWVNGHLFDARKPSGIVRGGVAYIDVVRGVRAVGGFLTLGRHDAVGVTVAGRTLDFEIGSARATLEGASVKLPGAPFLLAGDTFIPFASLATLAEAKLSIDSRKHRALLALGRGQGFATNSGPAADVEDIAPSPTQALNFVTTGSTDTAGLHASVDIANVTDKPYVLTFPNAKAIAFVLSRNGSEVWSSAADVIGTEPTKVTIPAHGSIVVARNWADFDSLGAGRYLLRVRLMTAFPIDIAPISLGVVAPAPTTSSG